MVGKAVYDEGVFKKYFKEVRRIFLTKDYTEYTFRTPFENFIKGLNPSFRLQHEAKRKHKLGAPDFDAYRKYVKVGYIEAKDLDKNLDNELESDQIKKYSESINNVILTNYTHFILIRKGQIIFNLVLFRISDLNNSKFVISKDKIDEFLKFIETFFDYNIQTIKSAKELSFELSKRTKLLKELAKEQLEEDLSKLKTNEEPSSVYDFYQGIEELIKDITIEDCADAYAQTIAYGLFLAKLNCPKRLDRNTASSYIPQSIGIIRRIFINISGDSIPSNIAWIVEEIIDVLNASEKENILAQIDFRGKKDKDPFTFFYEDFLSLYEPEKRKHLGVYYTPRPVINFIVNSINQILKEDFDKLNGFAEDDVTVLDPAVGTGTFLWLVFLLTLNEIKNKGLRGLMNKKIENHILKDFYGLEILITAYIIAHLKLALVLKQWHYELKENDRIQVYLTNTLEPTEDHGLLPFMRELSEESKTANELKTRKPILVILGNPPYAGTSANKGKWITDLLKKGYTRADGSKDDGYYQVDGEPLGERNPKWLQDDYVKFIRFTQWKIDRAGQGIVGLITSHSYLDNPTFRGMRESLMNSYDRIYILNLHGNSLKKETCPDGSPDKNVFDIRQGVSIAIFVKNNRFKDKKIFYKDLYGKREYKYSWLDRNSDKIYKLKWQELKPKTPYYFFTPQDASLQEEYEKCWKITDIFPVNSVGIVTGRDKFVFDFDEEIVRKRIGMFRDQKTPDDYFVRAFNLGDKSNWKLKDVRTSIMNDDSWEDHFTQILYRPFDIRSIYYHAQVIERSRREVMQHMIQGDNQCLIFTRSISSGKPFDHIFCAKHGILGRFYPDSACITYFSPLYLYPDKNKKDLLNYTQGSEIKHSNINTKLIKYLSETYKKEVTPEDIFCYIYAVLYSNDYRTKYADFLVFDFPRIPFMKDYDAFKGLSKIGKELADLHLMKTKLKTSTKFDVEGSNVVKKVEYKDNKSYINENQFFDDISEDVWNFYIGGYKVLDKWLKSRKNRELDSNEIEHFLQVVEIIKHTIDHMKKIDDVEFLNEPMISS